MFARLSLAGFMLVCLLLSACQTPAAEASLPDSTSLLADTDIPSIISGEQGGEVLPGSTPYPTRPAYNPGELVDYIAQTGDTLPALASHFNTTVDEILKANPIVPADATTMPPGMPMRIPIYFAPFWGTPYQALPDSLFINGPAQVGFDVEAFVDGYPGWLRDYATYASGDKRNGAQLVELVAQNFSISPRLLLALLEYQSAALTGPTLLPELQNYPLGYSDRRHRGLYLQLVWAADTLNNGYYSWRTGRLKSFELANGRIERPDPWQNAASVSLQYYFSRILTAEVYANAVSPEGFAQVYRSLFGDPWQNAQPHITGNLSQPPLTLPFQPGRTWAFTGGPHSAWGTGEPFAALDFAPPVAVGGCIPTDEWGTAVAPGLVVRSETGTVVLDLDQDGDERTGWVIFYYHIGDEGRAQAGSVLNTGDPVGHPSCVGGRATGTHIHIVRKYNGEWIPADGPLAFNLEGWVAKNGAAPYLGTLTRFSRTVIACVCSDEKSQIATEATPTPQP
jgi:hypothetical protein